MSSAISGTRVVTSTRSASAIVVAVESTGVAAATGATLPSRMQDKTTLDTLRSITIAYSRECQILVVVTEIGLLVDLAHVQRGRTRVGEFQSSFGVIVIPVDEYPI